MTSRNTISQWFDEGVADGYDRMIVICDTYDYEDYCDFAHDSNLNVLLWYYREQSMQKIMEVYDLKMDKEQQLNEYRAYHLP